MVELTHPQWLVASWCAEMAAHVAFTVASRLIWCSEGLSGSLMDAEDQGSGEGNHGGGGLGKL